VDFKPIIARIIAALIGLAAAKLNAYGVIVEVTPETQMAIVVAVYGAIHTLSKQYFTRKR
jgi:hypothetical protein